MVENLGAGLKPQDSGGGGGGGGERGGEPNTFGIPKND